MQPKVCPLHARFPLQRAGYSKNGSLREMSAKLVQQPALHRRESVQVLQLPLLQRNRRIILIGA
jgi:hypothetical protein